MRLDPHNNGCNGQSAGAARLTEVRYLWRALALLVLGGIGWGAWFLVTHPKWGMAPASKGQKNSQTDTSKLNGVFCSTRSVDCNR